MTRVYGTHNTRNGQKNFEVYGNNTENGQIFSMNFQGKKKNSVYSMSALESEQWNISNK
jgi:acetoacetate decarboxylase